MYVYTGLYDYIFPVSYTSQTPFLSLIRCHSLSPFKEKEMEDEDVPIGKESSSLFTLIMGLQLLKHCKVN